MRKIIFFLVILFISVNCMASQDGEKGAGNINSLDISLDAAKHVFSDTHFKIIGACFWYHEVLGVPTDVYATSELDEYLPDLIVSVYNGDSTDPYIEFNETVDKVSQDAGKEEIKTMTGFNFYENGQTDTSPVRAKNISMKVKSVDVIGSPMNSIPIPFQKLKSDTKFLQPYYMSSLDAIPDRSGTGEVLEDARILEINNYIIGNSITDYWGYEFPRYMEISQPNDFKASVVLAQRAADIASNKNTGHVVKSLNDSCGKNCAVANVIEEKQRDHEIWEMVYPYDKIIQPGSSDLNSGESQGSSDESKSNGNYVFLLWRHYRGCVQGDHYIGATVNVPDTQKR